MDNSQLNNLLKIASQRLGTTPEALKEAAQNGNLGRIVGDKNQGDMLSKVLSDPNAAQKLLSTPQAQKLLKMLK